MNIVLIGMPACGKSTIGVILAKTLGFSFVDTDLLIQSKEKMLLSQIISEKGNNEFINIEENVLLSIDCESTVIATGGSAVYSDKGIRHLKENGCVVYLRVKFDTVKKRIADIKTRGVVMPLNITLSQMYSARSELYEKYADIIIDADNLSVENCTETIIKEYKKYFNHNLKG